MKRLLALTIIAASFAVAGTATAAGQYLHITTDENYLADDGTILADPYGVGEGAGASHASILYWGPQANGDDHYVLEKAGWPYTRTLAAVAAAFPCVPNRRCFDHDAAAQLLANGLTWSALDGLYEQR